MTPLNEEQKQLIFDYCIGLTTAEETAEAQRLISSSREAAEICTNLKVSVAPLDNLRQEICPDDLAENTVYRLNNLARASQLRLEQLLAAEQIRSSSFKSGIWRNISQRLTMAAAFMIVGGIMLTALNLVSKLARQKSWQQMCQMQLANIWQGISNYSSDNNGQLPAVATTAGEPWWKIGYQGKENYSNTRPVWLLVKGGYVNPSYFVCPGVTNGKKFQLDPAQIKNCYNDFPDRKCVTYSFRIMQNKAPRESMFGGKILMSDSNPLFEELPDHSRQLILQLNDKLLTINSMGHNRNGQNILFGDGSVKFVNGRRIGIDNDDIFTLWNTPVYKGCEVPTCEADVFLAP